MNCLNMFHFFGKLVKLRWEKTKGLTPHPTSPTRGGKGEVFAVLITNLSNFKTRKNNIIQYFIWIFSSNIMNIFLIPLWKIIENIFIEL
jgi:hypothetical protein